MPGVVSVDSVSMVVPAVPTAQPCELWLCNFQLQTLSDNYIKQVYYYPAAVDPTSPGSYDQLVSGLKDSLSRILVLYFPLAGRPRITNIGRPVINCNDRGVEFVVAHANASFSDWEGSMNKCSVEMELNPSETVITDLENSPQLKIQVTKFRCGGIALGLVSTDNLLDGSSAFPFITSWSELHRGLPLPNPPPCFDSSLLKARDPPKITVPVRDYISISPSISQEIAKAGEPSYVIRTFHMNELQLSQLKQEIASGPFAYSSSPTAFEAVSSLTWKCITEARDSDNSGNYTFMYAVSTKLGKARWQPSIPSEYCGTSSFMRCLPCAIGDLKNKHISYIARVLHEDVQNINQEMIQSTIDWMEETLKKGDEIGLNVPPPKTGMGVYNINLHSFDVYNADFGWGPPLVYSMVLEPWYGNGVVLFLPTPDGGMRNRRIAVTLLEEQMHRLTQNQLFTKFVTME